MPILFHWLVISGALVVKVGVPVDLQLILVGFSGGVLLMFTSLWSWLAGRAASLEKSSRRMADGGWSSIFRRGGGDDVVGFRMDAIAIVEPLEPGSTGVLDTECRLVEWQDAESA